MTEVAVKGGSTVQVRRHQTCVFGKHATSAPAELGGTINNVCRHGSCTFTEVARALWPRGGRWAEERSPSHCYMLYSCYSVMHYVTICIAQT